MINFEATLKALSDRRVRHSLLSHLVRKGAQESHVSAQREYLHAQSGSSSLCISLAVGMHS